MEINLKRNEINRVRKRAEDVSAGAYHPALYVPDAAEADSTDRLAPDTRGRDAVDVPARSHAPRRLHVPAPVARHAAARQAGGGEVDALRAVDGRDDGRRHRHPAASPREGAAAGRRRPARGRGF